MTLEFIFTRHSESTANVSRTISIRLSDSAPLTELGRRQAVDLLESLKTYRVIAVYSSPLTRAKGTAEIIAVAFGLEVELVDGLREPECGIIEGRNDAEAWRLHAAQELAWGAGSHDYRIPGGESFTDVQQRFIPGVNRIIAKHGSDAGAVILVSHGSVLRNMLPLILSNIDTGFTNTHGLCNCSCVVATGTPNRLVCVEWDGKRVASDESR